MKKAKTLILILLSFIVGLIVGIGLFYHEDWGEYTRHLEWKMALRDYNEGGDSSTRQCLYYFVPNKLDKNSATLKEIFCIIKE